MKTVKCCWNCEFGSVYIDAFDDTKMECEHNDGSVQPDWCCPQYNRM
jgi:hypothetical protein